MKVPLVMERFGGPDRTIGTGDYAGSSCYYKTGLLNTLIALNPRVCLEIGTHQGGTAMVFLEYFGSFRPDGILVTADVKKYVHLPVPCVRQAIVYPHSADVVTRHWVTSDELLDNDPTVYDKSVALNSAILAEWLAKIGADNYDFAFIDGDHARESLLRDIEIATRLTSPPHYMLLDDTKEGTHQVSVVYRDELLPKYDTYDFEDWPIFVGASLIWKE
jgi:cephalosporin hydroxylase